MGKRKVHRTFRSASSRRLRSKARVPLYLFLFFSAVYLLLGQGLLNIRFIYKQSIKFVSVTSGDETVRAALTERFVENHTLELNPKGAAARIVPRGRDGRAFSYFGIAKSLWNIPFFLLSKIPQQLSPAFRGLEGSFISFSNTILSTLLIMALWFLLRDLGFSVQSTLLTLFTYGFATMAFSHAKYNVIEPMVSLSLVLTFLFLFRFRHSHRLFHLVLAALFLGIGMHTRASTILAAPLALGYLWFCFRNKNQRKLFWKAASVFVLVLVPFIALQLAYNFYRYGNLLEFGYGLKGDYFIFSPLTILHNAFATLVSPYGGLFVCAPVLLFSLMGAREFFRKHREEAWFLVGTGVVFWLLFAAWWYWFAFYAGGPRFLGQIHFLFLPFLAQGLEHRHRWSGWLRGLFWAAFLWGFMVNALFIVASPRRARYIEGARNLIKHRPTTPPNPTPREVWNPLNSHIVEQFQQVVDMVVQKEIRIIPQTGIRKFFNTPNFWWLHYRNMGVSLFWIYLAVVILLGLALWSAGQLKRAYDLSGRGRSARLQ